MPNHAGPKSQKRNSLVFGYDTGDTNNSYSGEPTTNELIGSTWAGDGSNQGFAGKGYTVITDPLLKYKGNDTVLYTPGTSLNGYLTGNGGDVDYSSTSTEWTFSCYVKRQDGAEISSLNVYMYYPSSDGNSAGTITPVGNGWYRVHRTRTGTSNFISLVGFTGLAAGYRYYLSGWQLEKKLHPTRAIPINTSRSSTNGLKDITRTYSINTSLAGFDSNSQINASPSAVTDDFKITFSPTISFGVGSTWTLETVLKRPSTNYNSLNSIAGRGSTNPWVIHQGYTDWWRVRFRESDGTYWDFAQVTEDGSDWVNNYYHVILTSNGTTITCYVNGKDKATRTPSVTTCIINQIMAGYSSGGNKYAFEGEMPIFKIYNEGFTQANAIRNYRTYKSRFELTDLA